MVTIATRVIKTEKNPNYVDTSNLPKTPRPHQVKAKQKIKDAIMEALLNNVHTIIPFISSVGSGKTDMEIDSIYYGIKTCEERGEKSVSFFVCPSLKLISGQIKELNDIKEKLEKEGVTGVEVQEWDCRVNDIDREKNFYNKHLIIIVCVDSLFGIDTNKGIDRFKMVWQPYFKKWIDEGRIGAAIVFDEAHNYGIYQIQMFGECFNL